MNKTKRRKKIDLARKRKSGERNQRRKRKRTGRKCGPCRLFKIKGEPNLITFILSFIKLLFSSSDF